MTIIKNYNFSITQCTAITFDSNGYIWLGFEKNASNVCLLRKVSASNPNQIYYEIEMSVDEIKGLNILGSYLYVIVDDSSTFAYRYNINSPLTVSTSISIPSGINEAPVGVLNDGTYVYILTPGEISGEVAKILKYSTSLSLNTTITLTAIQYARSFTVSGSDLWVVTYESPSKLIRVYDDGGYTFDTTTLS